MKILLIPNISDMDSYAMIHLAQRLANTFNARNYKVAAVANQDCYLTHVKIYDTPLPNKGFSLFKRMIDKGKTYEELLFAQGMLDSTFIENTLDAIDDAINHFKPDLIFDLGNPLAIVSARLHNIPVYSYGHVGMFRKRSFPLECLTQFNDALKERHLEQVLYIHDLFKYSRRIFIFGPSLIQPFDDHTGSIIRLGSMIVPPRPDVQDHLCIFLNEMNLRPRKVNDILEETFLGAPIKVDIYYPNCKAQTKNNLTFHNRMLVDRVANSKLCFHDGSEFLFNLCLSLGIPQVIINDSSCLVSWNAHAVKRYMIGDTFHTKDFSVASIYETYRRIVVDTNYYARANVFKEGIANLGGLDQIVTYMLEDIKPVV